MTSKVWVLVILATSLANLQAKPNDLLEEFEMHPPPKYGPESQSANLRDRSEENTAEYWQKMGMQIVADRLAVKENKGVAKNVIMFLGDGMSVPTVSATRVYKGKDEQTVLSFEKFPYTALSKTYCVDSQVADSACTTTAYLCGIKANRATIGVTANVKYGECETMADTKNHVKSIGYYSQKLGKATGFVTKAKVTDASPAGLFAHTSTRNWETDADVENSKQDPKVCVDVATQLIDWEEGKNLDVIMGGGRGNFLPKSVTDEDGQTGARNSDVNLIDKWKQYRVDAKKNGVYISNRAQLLKNITNQTDMVLGLFSSGDMPYNLDRNPDTTPSLAEMTRAAISVLAKNPKGYFLFVEGALIDKAHHAARAQKSIDDTVEFADAIELAVNITSESDTLIVVTADHAHTMSFSGYAARGHDIFGVAGKDDDIDNAPYTTLSYANGPGYVPEASRIAIDETKLDKNYQYRSTVKLGSETHGGDDVAIYARGPWSHLFSGVLEQHAITHIMSFASCVNDGNTACKQQNNDHHNNGAGGLQAPLIIALLSVICHLLLRV